MFTLNMIKFLVWTMVVGTIYHADPRQTNADYLTTASLKTINKDAPGSHRWIAVSRDLEKLGFVFGAKVCVENAGKMNGIWYVEDRMNRRWTRRIDFLVSKKIRGGKWDNVKIRLEIDTKHQNRHITDIR